MRIHRSLVRFGSGALLFCSAGALALPAQQPATVAAAAEIESLTKAVDQVVRGLRLQGAALAVLRQNGEVHRSEHGGLGADHPLPIASASKWLTVATVLTLVDDGTLDLDAPVARYLEEFDRDDKDDITLRQCLACTAGFPARLPGRMRGWDMDDFAEAAADRGLQHDAGDGFRYGGVTFQVAAAAAVRATGKSWHDLFTARIASPLGLEDTAFGGLLPLGDKPGTHPLPWVGGGAVSTLDDYSRFVQCLVNKGQWRGHQVLSAKSVKTMFQDQVHPRIAVRAVGVDAEPVRYGLGTWIFELENGNQRVADPGAFGFTPWIDLDLGVAGVFAVQDRVRRVFGRLVAVMDTVREVAESPVLAGVEELVTLSHDGRERRYHLHVPPIDHQTDTNGATTDQQASGQQSPGMPLVIVLHGGGGNGERIARVTGIGEIADREGFVAAFPDGTGKLRHRLLTWNDGVLPVYAKDHDVDDVGFLREVVRDIARRVPIDSRRVFVAGHSNGGMMCHRLARDAADLFAGIAVVAGAMNYTASDIDTPVAVMLVHGTADEHVKFEGGRPDRAIGRARRREDASVQAAIDYYVARNGLVAYPERVVDSTRKGVTIDTYDRQKGSGLSTVPVTVITLAGGGHAWPGSRVAPGPTLRDPVFDFDASQAIWDFFARVRRPIAAAGGVKGGDHAAPPRAGR